MNKLRDFNVYIQESAFELRAVINKIVDYRWEHDPFGKTPFATRQQYLSWFEETRRKAYPEVDLLEADCGYSIDREWLDELAFHTQITCKKSELGYPHGRILYSLLRKQIISQGWTWVDIVETGTARGFSALCMAKAVRDAGVDGRIITIDVLSHLKPQIWNCIDDHDGPKSRAKILEPWADLLKMITFLQGDTLYMLQRIGLERINFAFLDAQHTEKSVIQEFQSVQSRQVSGDMVVFDDVTPAVFPGVVNAVNRIEMQGGYKVDRLSVSQSRSYAWVAKY
jgi:predicted O-methyltransferase YrrM